MGLYHDAIYDWSHTVDSWWESERHSFAKPSAECLNSDETADVAIIGGGYCGLSAAYHVNERVTLLGEVNGRANTRGSVPRGTESNSEVRFGARFRAAIRFPTSARFQIRPLARRKPSLARRFFRKR